MKIKLALLEQDQGYLNKITMVFSTKYADKLEIYSFTNLEIALAALDSARIDVLVAGSTFEINADALPRRCGFAYFVESADIEAYKGQRAICKFQKADLIYRQILSIYSEVAGSVSGLKMGDDHCKVIAFTSPCGGTGTSSVAAAYAIRSAAGGQKTLYLNLEKFGSSDVFFASEGQFDMSDIVFALKSKKTNLSMKLESCVKQDPRGVFFYSQSKVALDMLELNAEDVLRLLAEAKISDSYSRIVLDMDFSIDKDSLAILRQANAVIWVGDGLETSNRKLLRAYEALKIKEQNEDAPITGRLALIYNKFSNKSSRAVESEEIKNIGGAPRYEHATTEQVVEQLGRMQMLDNID